MEQFRLFCKSIYVKLFVKSPKYQSASKTGERHMSNVEEESANILETWLDSCTRGGKLSRNTISVGLVVLDHLRHKCPVSRSDVISSGGEIKGARSGLGNILEKYGLPRLYLKEVTTRQGHQDGQRLFDAYQWGNQFTTLSDDAREKLLQGLTSRLVIEATEWLRRQNLKLDLDRRQSPTTWVNLIVESAKQRSGGIVEQHLVGAKLEKRFLDFEVPNYPAHAADVQTARTGDFTVDGVIYHVTATPGASVVQKCANNIKSGGFPVLLVPKAQEYRALALAQEVGIEKELAIISIEDFIALNIIEMAVEQKADFFTVLQEIVQIYNRRLAEVETDLSLQIEVR
jgi:hypothetical protein